MERETAAKLAAATVEESAAAERARLQLEAAEDKAAAGVANSSVVIEALVEEKRLVIAARAEARALAAREQALRDGVERSRLEILVDAYKAYLENASHSASFEDWLGSLEV